MHVNQQVGLTLSKSNLSLMLTLCELTRSQGIQMLDELEKNLESCYHEFEATAKNLLSANDWISVVAALGNMPYLVMRLQTQQLQKILESWIKTQLRVSTVAREAVSNWQRESATALQETAGAMPLSATLRGFYGQAPATPPQASATTTQGRVLPLTFH
ncbi:MAG: hypothetical protein FGM18_05820 [Burkholderiaceae bacterium]|nr:hypothetical protein [Burkholderiaceae bacterium]